MKVSIYDLTLTHLMGCNACTVNGVIYFRRCDGWDISDKTQVTDRDFMIHIMNVGAGDVTLE